MNDVDLPPVPASLESVATLSFKQVARLLGIDEDTLAALHKKNDGPPRYRLSPNRWGYVLQDLRRWQEQRMAQAGAQTRPIKRKRRQRAQAETSNATA
jgi:predicted DNA-binding transcriptional regulator AlpA